MVCITLTYDHAEDILALYIMRQSSLFKFWHHCIQSYSSFWTKMLFLHFAKLFICFTSTEDIQVSKWEKEISIATYLWQKHPVSEMQHQMLRV